MNNYERELLMVLAIPGINHCHVIFRKAGIVLRHYKEL
jgi:hypothetical protein